jgi:hypothetical protein
VIGVRQLLENGIRQPQAHCFELEVSNTLDDNSSFRSAITGRANTACGRSNDLLP